MPTLDEQKQRYADITSEIETIEAEIVGRKKIKDLRAELSALKKQRKALEADLVAGMLGDLRDAPAGG